jgi:catechol 2,3-dioxygenase-like lactoylglutathione lyase family enzyme
MEQIISDLVNSYEKRALTRRQLVQALATLTAAGAAGSTRALAQSDATAGAPMLATTLDHLSIQVKDLDRSVKFYQSVFGLPFINKDEKTQTVRLKVGPSRVAIRVAQPYGVYDHVGFGVAHLNKADVKGKLKAMGVEALETGEPLQFHVVDPDANPIQIISLDNRQ